MINWQSIIFNSFWIFGLALLLAAFSYHYWEAAENGRALRVQLSSPGFLRLLWMALLLISIGLLGTGPQFWEMVLWAGVAVAAIVNMALLSRRTVP